MGNACKPFGLDIDMSMRCFSVVEMFMSVFHIIAALSTYQDFVENIVLRDLPYYDDSNNARPAFLTSLLAIYRGLMSCLLLQAIFGGGLYYFGYIKRIWLISLLWIIVACLSFLFATLGLIMQLFRTDKEVQRAFDLRSGQTFYWSNYYLYLLYVILGVWIVINFLKFGRRIPPPAYLPPQIVAALEEVKVLEDENASEHGHHDHHKKHDHDHGHHGHIHFGHGGKGGKGTKKIHHGSIKVTPSPSSSSGDN